jgi:NAD(P)-dependent dehydrogenase (short-subunit alcohol dehydrogenase family)
MAATEINHQALGVDLNGRVAVVTGGGGGIGSALARGAGCGGQGRGGGPRVDVFFAKAVVGPGAPLGTEGEWKLELGANVMAHVRAARLLVLRWVERGGGYSSRPPQRPAC